MLTVSKVAITKCPDYNRERVEMAVRKVMELLGGIEKFVKKDDTVLLKPNLLMRAFPEEAVTTHPEVLRALIKLVLEAGGEPLVGDSPGFNLHSFDDVATSSGIKEVALEMGAKLVDLSVPVKRKNPEGVICKSFTVAKAAVDADCIITIPKLKTHAQTYFTGAIKNLFGCIPGRLKGMYHLKMPKVDDFSRMLVDLNRVLRPKLAVMDAVIGMDGEGPGKRGSPKFIGLILASSDPTALDAVASEIVGIDSFSIPTTRIATQTNFGTGRLEEIQVLGQRIDDARISDFKRVKRFDKESWIDSLPAFLKNGVRNVFTAKPFIDYRKCTSCKTCIEACPARPKAIDFRKNRPVIHYNHCIRCYCCHELCPEGAIALRTGVAGNLITRWLVKYKDE